MPYYTYVLQSISKGVLYKGYTEDIEQRLLFHNSGLSNYTSKHMPWKLVHYEVFGTKKEALQREKFFKSGKGRQWLKENLKLEHLTTDESA